MFQSGQCGAQLGLSFLQTTLVGPPLSLSSVQGSIFDLRYTPWDYSLSAGQHRGEQRLAIWAAFLQSLWGKYMDKIKETVALKCLKWFSCQKGQVSKALLKILFYPENKMKGVCLRLHFKTKKLSLIFKHFLLKHHIITTCSCCSVFSSVSTTPSGWDNDARVACSCSSQSSNTCNPRWYSWWTSTSPLALLTAFCKTTGWRHYSKGCTHSISQKQ